MSDLSATQVDAVIDRVFDRMIAEMLKGPDKVLASCSASLLKVVRAALISEMCVERMRKTVENMGKE